VKLEAKAALTAGTQADFDTLSDMTGPEQSLPELVLPADIPGNVIVGTGTVLTGRPFRRFRSVEPDSVSIGAHCTLDHSTLAVGERGRLSIGDHCYFTSAVVLCEEEVRIGNYVVFGWNTTLSDSDFHPLDPAQRVQDAIALSPIPGGVARPPISAKPVVIEDDVWLGAAVVVLKGVTIGAGSWIEPGSVVTSNVPPRSRVAGNPGRVLGTL
jgi:acetyltransferase-like isoleucine patch superfamily enzyme